MDKKREIVKVMGKYSILKYYANTLYTNNDKENGKAYYGDIYLTKEDVLKNHPEAKILEGFGFIDNVTGCHPDDAPDWFDSIKEVMEYIEEN